MPSRSTPARGDCGPGCWRTETPRPAVLAIFAICSCGVAVGSGVGDSAGVGGGVGALAAAGSGVAMAVGALAAVTRGVTAGVGTTVGSGVLLGSALTRTGGSARPAFSTARAATALINPSNSRLLRICQMVTRSRPPLDKNARPHQSHSVEPRGFFPPQPGHTTIALSGGLATAGVFYTRDAPRVTTSEA